MPLKQKETDIFQDTAVIYILKIYTSEKQNSLCSNLFPK